MSRPSTTPFDHILDFLETAPPDEFRKVYQRTRHVALRRGIALNGRASGTGGVSAKANRKPRTPHTITDMEPLPLNLP